MAAVELVRVLPGPPEHVFAVVADLPAHGRYLPLTRISHDPLPIGVGWRFTGRSGPGPLAVVDRMRVTDWDPPHGFAVEKLGPVLTGWARAELEPVGEDTRVIWREEIVPRPVRVGRHLAPLSDRVTRWLFARALDRMAHRAARG